MITIFGETPVTRRLKASSIVLVEDMAGIILQGVSMAGTPRRPEGKGTICLQMLRIFSWRKIYHAAVVGIVMLLKICGSESANELASEPPNDLAVRA